MKNKLLISLIILAVIFGTGTFIAVKNSTTSNSLSNSSNNATNSQSDKDKAENNESELVNNAENNEEEVPKEENNITDEQNNNNNNSSESEKKDTQKTEPKKEEKKTTNNDEQEKPKSEPKKEEKKTTNNDEQEKPKSEPVIEDRSVKSLSFNNNYITKEVSSGLSYNGGSYVTISSMSYLTKSLDEVKKMNTIIVNPSNAEYNEISYTSSNKNVADFVDNELRIYTYGETTITATTDNGVSGSYKVKFIPALSVKMTAMRKIDYTSTKKPFPYYIGFQFNISSMSCNMSQQFELDLTLYREDQKVDNVKISNDYKSNRYVIYTLEDIAGNYYAEYTITDKCNNNTKTGKSRTVYISTESDQTYGA